MDIKEFSKKYKLSSLDASIAERLHKGKQKTEKEWYDTLKSQVVIRVEYKESKKEKIESIKNAKKNSLKKTDKQ